MSSDPDFHRSADAWLDGSATPGEGKILQEILTDHPGESRNFAHLARTHAALELASKTKEERLDHVSQMLRPSLRQNARRLLTHPTFKWTAAAAALAVGAAWWLQQSNLENPDSGGVDRVQKQKAAAVANTQVAPSPLTNLPPADTGYTKRMENFIIPEFSVDGMELLEAIALLTDKVTGLGENATFQVEITGPTPDSANHQVFLNLNYQPASTLLHLIALQTGMKVQASGQTWHLFPAAEPASDSVEYQEISAERWQAFRLSQMPPPPPTGGIVGHVSGRGLEPPPKSLPATAEPLPDLKQLSAALINAVREAPHSVEPVPPQVKSAATTLRVGSSQKLNAMLALLLGGDHAPGTVTYEIQWLKLASPSMSQQLLTKYRTPAEIAAGNGAIRFAPAAMQQLLADLLSEANVKIAAGPPLLLAPGRKGNLVAPDSSSTDVSRSDWIGQLCTITSLPQGGRATLEITLKTAALNAEGGISGQTVENRSTLELGTTALVRGTIDDTGESVALITARAAGEYPFAIRVSGKPGYVRSPYALEKGEVDVGGIPGNTKVKCPYTGAVFRVPEP